MLRLLLLGSPPALTPRLSQRQLCNYSAGNVRSARFNHLQSGCGGGGGGGGGGARHLVINKTADSASLGLQAAAVVVTAAEAAAVVKGTKAEILVHV
ncbi:uncharacterized [Lates japonicus]